MPTPMTPPPEDIARWKEQLTVSPAQAAVISGYSENTIRRAIAAGELACNRVGTRIGVLTDALTTWATGKAS